MHRTREIIALVCRAGAGTVLLWAGVAKALDRQASILAVNAYDVLPAGLVRPVATALPWVEVALGLFLLTGMFLRFSGVGTAGLTVVFIAALAQAKARGLAIDCGCFGGGGPGSGVSWFDIARDLPLALAGGFVAFLPGRWLQLDRLLRKEELDESPTGVEGREAADGGQGPPSEALVGRAEG